MNAFLDSSIVGNYLLNFGDMPSTWSSWDEAYCSDILRVETRRVLNRLRLEGAISQADHTQLLLRAADFERSVSRLPVSRDLLDLACRSTPVHIKTLDLIHLVTAVAVRQQLAPDLIFMTADIQQARAARSFGFEVIGV